MAAVRGDHCKGAGAVVRLRRASSIIDVAMPSLFSQMLRTVSCALFFWEGGGGRFTSSGATGAPSGSMVGLFEEAIIMWLSKVLCR
jgi:hypothetical protein